jgi:tRNA threonylcarbamoyladenosine biosynthesis protein TsaE
MRSIGASLALALSAVEEPMVIALEGELGAGKTTFVGGVLKQLGFHGHVRSPTDTLIEPYDLANRSIYHLDLYRLISPREVEALGVRELLVPGAILLIEWPNKGAGALPPFDLTLQIRYLNEDAADEGREIRFVGDSEAGQSVIQTVLATAKPEQGAVSP